MLIKEKKCQKVKILDISFTKKTIVEMKNSIVNNFADYFTNVISSTFFQDESNQAKYKNRALVYPYYLSLIFYDFNQVKLDILFSTSLLSFYSRCNIDSKKALKDVFESVYHYIKYNQIANITTKAFLWLEISIENNYYKKYHYAH